MPIRKRLPIDNAASERHDENASQARASIAIFVDIFVVYHAAVRFGLPIRNQPYAWIYLGKENKMPDVKPHSAHKLNANCPQIVRNSVASIQTLLSNFGMSKSVAIRNAR